MLKKKPPCNPNRQMQKKQVPNKKNVVRRVNENVPSNMPIHTSRYIKKDTLGEGSYGVVYKAFDTETGKIVAIKCLKTKESIESFQSELDLLKRLHHTAIVPYLDSFYDKKGLEIVMEYADNGSILDVIHTYGSLNENVAAIYISQVLQGLSYLHKQNVIHRDIKAANILVQAGVAKLADFGLALDLNEYGHTLRECAGTPYWMAPECINGDPVNHKCDIWSVGSTTIELLTGHPPLFDLAPMPAMFQIAGERPMPIPKNISDKCKNFLLSCFKKNPKRRPEAEELLQHQWITQALQVMKSAHELSTMKHKKKSHDYKSLSICLESVAGLNAYIDNQQERTPEEIIFDLNDSNYYEESVYNTIQLLKTKKDIPQLVLNFCGLRTLIDHYETEKHKTITLNLFQELAVNSDRIASSFIEHGLIQDMLNCQDPHSKITAMLILMNSSSGNRIFFGCRLYSYLPKLFETPEIGPFIPTFLLKILGAEFPTILLTSKLFTKQVIKMIIETVFKSIVLREDYQNLIDKNFKNMKSVRSKHDLLQPQISDNLFEKTKAFIQDSLSLLHFVATLSLETQIIMSKEMDPLIYLLVHAGKFANLCTDYINKLISVFNIIFQDRCARTNVKCDLLLNPLISRLDSEDESVSSSALNCLTLMLLNNPALTEQAAINGLCESLYNIINQNESSTYAYHLICYIPTVSQYSAYKMKEAHLFEHLIGLTTSIEWREKAVQAISEWSIFDHKYVDQQILEYNIRTDDAFVSLYEICIEMIKNYHIRLIWFTNLKSIARNCTLFAKSINNNDFYDLILSALENAEEFKIDLLDLLLEVLLQAEDSALSASSILPKLKGYSENPDFRIQKTVLRIRVISGQ